MNKIIRCFVIMQSMFVLTIIFLVRFFDYVVTNTVTVMFKPFVFIAILITILLSLIISMIGLFKYKARKGSLVSIWINLFTILLLFLPIREWGIEYNFNRYYEQRNIVVSEYCKEKFDRETYIIASQIGDEFSHVTSNDRVGVFEKEEKLCFFFPLYNGILGASEGFIFITDVTFQPEDVITEINQYYQIKENWYFGAKYNR